MFTAVSILGILTSGYTLSFTFDNWFLDEETLQFYLSYEIGILVGFVIFGMILYTVLSLDFISSGKIKTIKQRQQFIKNKILGNKNGGIEYDIALVKSSLNPCGDIDFDYYKKIKRMEQKKIVDF